VPKSVLDQLRWQMDLEKKTAQDLEQKLLLMSEQIAQKILSEKTQGLQQESSRTLSDIVLPMKEKFNYLQQKIESTYDLEAKERYSLKQEIQRLVDSSLKMGKETAQLTSALRGDVKKQGNWGEFILERVLESSGLRDGHEFLLQSKNLQLKDEEGRAQRPDVIILLPGEKHLVVDAKVSLVSFERMINQEAADGDQYYKQFYQSITQHIESLWEKKYQHNEKLLTPDVVFMFIPIEGAITLLIQKSPEVLEYAWKKSIALVGPSTLMSTLKVVSSLWKQDKQEKNSQEIALEAGKLFDKCCVFFEDLQRLSDGIKKIDESFDLAKNRLSSGRGNIISRLQYIKELGITHSKEIPSSYLSTSEQ
jgi:DNA recombination protein RmuC